MLFESKPNLLQQYTMCARNKLHILYMEIRCDLIKHIKQGRKGRLMKPDTNITKHLASFIHSPSGGGKG